MPRLTSALISAAGSLIGALHSRTIGEQHRGREYGKYCCATAHAHTQMSDACCGISQPRWSIGCIAVELGGDGAPPVTTQPGKSTHRFGFLVAILIIQVNGDASQNRLGHQESH
jgi:hypothetical protein